MLDHAFTDVLSSVPVHGPIENKRTITCSRSAAMGFGAAAAVEEEAASPFFPLAAATLRDSSGHSSATPRTCTQASAARGGASLQGDGTTASFVFADDAAASASELAFAVAAASASASLGATSWAVDVNLTRCAREAAGS